MTQRLSAALQAHITWRNVGWLAAMALVIVGAHVVSQPLSQWMVEHAEPSPVLQDLAHQSVEQQAHR